MTDSKKELLSYLENMSLLFLGILFLAFPLIFSQQTTETFVLPKQILLGSTVLVSFLFFGVRMLLEGRVRLKTTPFDLPLFFMTVTFALSSYLSLNKFDALIAYIPFLFGILVYFIVVNVVTGRNATLFLLGSLVTGAALSSVLTILASLKVTFFPFTQVLAQTQTTMGSLLDQSMYLAVVATIAGYVAYPLFEGRKATQEQKPLFAAFAAMGVLIVIGLLVTLFLLFKQKPALLPFSTGFQTAFAAISQDGGRQLMSFLFGSGFGTFVTVFTKFKQATYNAFPTLWSITFFRSSSFILELLATTGFLGFLSFMLLLYRFIRTRVFYLPLILVFAAAFLLPFSYNSQMLLFFVLAVFAILHSRDNERLYQNLEFYFVALKRGLVTTEDAPIRQYEEKGAKILPIILFVILAGLFGGLAYISTRFVISDVLFKKSFVAASKNDGLTTYRLQESALKTFLYKDTYHSIFAQTNLALANSVANSQPKNSSPSAQTSQQILGFIQQSINAGKSATAISPLTASNWNNLSSIYRSLIGFGQNAEVFARDANLQAIQLDSTNPQQYINLGGIYYQLQQWDLAEQAFIRAIDLKSDYANAYYNLGHTMENKGDLSGALRQYQVVEQLVKAQKEDITKIQEEIKVLQAKIAKQTPPQSQAEDQTGTDDLSINQPETTLPEQKEKAPIDGPEVKLTPTPTPSTPPSKTPSPSLSN